MRERLSSRGPRTLSHVLPIPPGAVTAATRVGLLAVLVICVACGAGPVQASPTSDAWVHYQIATLGFDHPIAWKERPQRFLAGSFFGTIGLFSTRQPEQDLCYRRPLPGGGTEQGCDSHRLGKLTAGDVVLIVGSGGMPGQNTLPAGAPLVVDGHDATLSSVDPSCLAAMGGDSSVTLTILSSPSTEISFSACGLKVPDLEQTMRRLAASTHLAPPSA
jgi:hypothetical protein